MFRRAKGPGSRYLVLIAVSILVSIPSLALDPSIGLTGPVAALEKVSEAAGASIAPSQFFPVSSLGGPGTPHAYGPIPVGTDPDAIAFSPLTHQMYVANRGSSNVSIVNVTTDKVTKSVPVGSSPSAVAFDTANASLFVTNSNSHNVSVLNSTGSVVRSLPVGTSPDGLAYDATSGDMFVLNALSANVTVFSSLLAVSGSFPVVVPGGMAFDPLDSYLYVSNYSAGLVVPYNATTHVPSTPIRVGTDPAAISFDPVNGDLYVANYGSDDVTVINGTTGSVVTTLPVGTQPRAIGVDTLDGNLYVANSGTTTVTYINGSSNQILGWGTVGNSPVAVAFDRLNGKVFVANFVSGTVSVISTGFLSPDTFTEKGLPTGTTWAVTLGGVTRSTSGTSVVFRESNGTYPYQVSRVSGYEGIPSSGVGVFTGIPQNTSVLFRPTYPLTFDEWGLPGGTNWSVTVNGSLYPTPNATLPLLLPNGTYVYNFTTPISQGAWKQFVPSPSYGVAKIAGKAESVNVSYRVEYYLNTSVSNLSYGHVSPLPGWYNASGMFSLAATASAGDSFVRWAGTGPGAYSGAENPHPFILNASVNESAVFSKVWTYHVTFTETGLPAGTFWSVDINGPPVSNTSPTIQYALANGTYSFYLLSPIPGSQGTRYTTNGTGTVTVQGVPVSVSIPYVTQYSLTVTAGPPAGGLVTPGSGWHPAGVSLTLNYTSSANYRFVGWSGNGNGSYSGAQPSPTVHLNEPVSEVAEFEQLYSAVFGETGLPAGTSWGVTVNGTPLTSTSTSTNLSLPDGKYPYTVIRVTGYTAYPDSGTLTISGAPPTKVTMGFTINAKPSQKFLGLPELDWILLAGVGAVAVVGILLVIRMGRRREPSAGSAEEAPVRGDEDTSGRGPDGPDTSPTALPPAEKEGVPPESS